MNVSLTVFQGRAGDHNDLAIPRAKSIALLLSRQLGLEATVVGTPEPALSTHWRTELDVAMPALRAMQGRFQRILSRRYPAPSLDAQFTCIWIAMF